MNDREEFEKWATAQGYELDAMSIEYFFTTATRQAFVAYQAGRESRQPEIDALKAEVERLKVAPTPPEHFRDVTKMVPAQDAPVGCSDGYGTRIAEYRTPADDKLRKAAEEVIDRFYNGKCDGELEECVINLRYALEGK